MAKRLGMRQTDHLQPVSRSRTSEPLPPLVQRRHDGHRVSLLSTLHLAINVLLNTNLNIRLYL